MDGGQFCSINSVCAASAFWVQAYADGFIRKCASWYMYTGSGKILRVRCGMVRILLTCVRQCGGGEFSLSSAKAAICVDYVVPFNSAFLGRECVAQGLHGVQSPGIGGRCVGGGRVGRRLNLVGVGVQFDGICVLFVAGLVCCLV